MLHRLIVVALMLFLGFAVGKAAAQQAIGDVSRLQGKASGTQGGVTKPLGLKSSVFGHAGICVCRSNDRRRRQV
jgi:hypothetical protein